MRVVNVPNAITAVRVVLAPVFLWLYATGSTDLALAAFAAAAATDLLDGLAARLLDQRTRLGALLDAAADKLLMACALVALAWRGQLPWWLPALVLGRDALLAVGTSFLAATEHPMEISPTRLGKYATAVLAATVVLALLAEFGGVTRGRAAPWVAALGLLSSLLVVVSACQYAYYFVRGLEAQPSTPGRR
ncbi:MAG TPA: CDP-alcohol phosphatidyltransferase family protein [Anaeromyxobacteraceae bacterium]|nr:CDP-alcohol phosphatidyltransferase family protein [Anaeromyxobacteraceae bacterium]